MENAGNRQVIVVTGASSGVGRAVARAFGKRGARVGLLARNAEALETAAGEIRRDGGEALVQTVDVSDADAVEAAAAAITEQWGHIDTWVNVAMVTVFAPITDMTPDEYRRVTEVTYLGYVHGTQAALRRMRAQDHGIIVQIGSALAYRSLPLQSAYCAAKHAIIGFTDSLRTELIHEGSNVKVTVVDLPAVNTPQALRQRNKMPQQSQPAPPMIDPDAIADSIVWASEHTPREMLVGNATVLAVWGQKLFPGLLDWYLGRKGWSSQFVDKPNEQHGRDILFTPLSGDPGAHGPYRDREHGADLQMRLRIHPKATLATALGVITTASVVATAMLRRS